MCSNADIQQNSSGSGPEPSQHKLEWLTERLICYIDKVRGVSHKHWV